MYLEKQSPIKYKKAYLLGLDLILTIGFILVLIFAIISQLNFFSTERNQTLKNKQILSIVLQESTLLYTNTATKISSPTYLSDVHENFTKVGYFNHSSFSSYILNAGARATTYGLNSLNYYLSNPPIYSDNQICVKRLMLKENKKIQQIWVCAS